MSRLLVGDDVVDLARERTRGKSADSRFVERVFTPREALLIRDARDPDLELWTLWACKEAAFKIHSKARGAPPVFVHTDYRVDRTHPEATGGNRPTEGRFVALAGGEGEEVSARVHWDGGAAAVGVRRNAAVVHAVAWAWSGGAPEPPSGVSPRAGEAAPPRVPASHGVEAALAELDDPDAPWAAPLEKLLGRMSTAEADAVHSRASAAVRLGARATLARMLGVEEERLEIVCAPGKTGRRPPSVRLDGAACEADVSFTHDGRWVAWSASVPREPLRRRV